jgi:hypothetical protein
VREWPSLDKAIAEPDHGLDLSGGDAQLAAQSADVHVHRARLHSFVVTSDAFQQAVTRHDPVPVLDEVSQQLPSLIALAGIACGSVPTGFEKFTVSKRLKISPRNSTSVRPTPKCLAKKTSICLKLGP